MMNNFLSTLFDLFFPPTCSGCKNLLLQNERAFCTQCKIDLPKTNFHDDPENNVNKLFWGKVKVEASTAFLYYNKKGIVQEMIHSLKYKSNKLTGQTLGNLLGLQLNESENFKNKQTSDFWITHKKYPFQGDL